MRILYNHIKTHIIRNYNFGESKLKFKKLTKNAFTPSKGSKLAAGFDLYSAYDITIPAYGKALVKTDIQLELPNGCYGRIAPRSGLSWKKHIDVAAGVIDRDYMGNIGVVLFNHAKVQYKVKKGYRVAQLICEKILYPELEETDEFMETERKNNGFGSTDE
nr:MAG: dUTPase [Metapenaeopsis lamellata majanivirus]